MIRLKYRIVIPFILFMSNFFVSRRYKKISKPHSLPLPFFIIGSGRNGSTLLALLLNKHSKIFLPPEQYVLPYAIMKWYIKSYKGWRKTCIEIIEDFKNNNHNWNLTSSDYINIKQKLFSLEKENRSMEIIYKTLISYYARTIKSDVSHIGDHSPNTTLFYKLIFKEFSMSKFIFLLRDPLDVIYSYSKLKGNPASNPVYAARKWSNSIKAYDWLRKKYSSSVLLIKYKDLVSDPDNTIKRVLEFLDLSYNDINSLDLEEERIDLIGVKGQSYHSNLYKPISAKYIGQGQRNLNTSTIQKIIPIVKENAVRFGYY